MKINYAKEMSVIEQYKNGLSYKDIQLKTGISKYHTQNILKKHNIQPRTGKFKKKVLSRKTIDQICDSYLAGSSLTAIAQEFKISTDTARNVLVDEEVEIKKCNYGDFSKSVEEIIENDNEHLHIKQEVTKLVKPDPEYNSNGEIDGYRIEFLLGVESPKIYTRPPKWKIEFEKKGIINYGYGYFPKEILQ